MRYIAKIHVLDVMDSVVVSGYYYDSDEYSDPDREVCEFTYQVQGLGITGGHEWLLNTLYRALLSEQTPPRVGD